MKNNDNTPRDLFDGIVEDATPRDPAPGEPMTAENTVRETLAILDGIDVTSFSDPVQQPPTKKDIPVEEWDELVEIAKQLKERANAVGIWIPTPPRDLIQRADTFFDQHVEALRDTMSKHNAAGDVIDAVCADYAASLLGVSMFQATPIQVQSALRAITPYEAFSIDRYGLYFGLLWNYSRFLLKLNEYRQAVKGDQATDDTRRNFLTKYYSLMDARAVRWLIDSGVVEPGDFADFNPIEIYTYFKHIDELTNCANYVFYYTVARTALVATPEELADITPPDYTPFFNPLEPYPAFAEQVVKDIISKLAEAAKKFAGAVTADTSTEREQARQAGKDWGKGTADVPIKIYENYANIMARPVEVSPHGERIERTLPVRRYISDYISNHKNECVVNVVDPKTGEKTPVELTITDDTIQKVIEGLNLLPMYLAKSMTTDTTGRLIFHTNISEFSTICGYVDANEPQKKALFNALLIMNNLYFVINKPRKYETITTAKGKQIKKLTGGLYAVRFINLPEVGLQSGDLIIEMYPESLKGNPVFMTPEIFKRLRAEAKSLPQRRFNNQVATKSHKIERELIDEVFGYADKIKYASPEETAEVNREIQKHRNRAQKKLLGWFDDYIKAGIITDFKREPSKTQKRDYVLSWKCANPSKLTPQPVSPDDAIAGE